MATYKVYYKKDTDFRTAKDLTEDTFRTNYAFVNQVDAQDVDKVYSMMQAENWSPNGEARILIEKLGLDHTSMSIGDLVEDVERERSFTRLIEWDSSGHFTCRLRRRMR